MAVKRINMDIDADLWKAAKKAAIDQDVRLRDWVAQTLKEKIDGTDVRGEKAISNRVPEEEQG